MRALQALNNSDQANQLAQATSKYFGEQAFTGGAWYWGIGVVFLFSWAFLAQKVGCAGGDLGP
ncbi:MAG: hypothetical protein IPO33_08110 [Saprospiraceae bacterium]|nr:hypothetical protein [Candidatus Brachybacter algidus]